MTMPHRVYDRVARLLSVLAALVALTLTSPVLLFTACAVRLTMGRPVFFTQTRPGLGGAPITVHKFRTMRQPDETLTAIEAVASDRDRLTTLGKALRATSVDELPQLLDVIRGDMNIVGPRPLLMEYLDRYSPYHARRHEVRPGITGWSQVNGRNASSWEARLDMDVWYVDNRSLRLDACILWRTIGVVFSGTGVSPEGYPIAVPFDGLDTKE